MAATRFSFLLAPGAGAPSSHSRMKDFSSLLAPLGSVTTFDYPYMLAGRRRPDRLPQLIAAHRAALDGLVKGKRDQVVLAGKSMGGRVGCHLALETPVAALVCFGYPLCAGGDRAKLRDEVLIELKAPILFVQGTRDALCPTDLLDDVRSKMRAPSWLHVVQAGDHSLNVSKKQLNAENLSQTDVDRGISDAIGAFLQDLVKPL